MSDETQQPLSKAQLTSMLLNLNSAAALIEAATITAKKARAVIIARRLEVFRRHLLDEMRTLGELRDEAAS